MNVFSSDSSPFLVLWYLYLVFLGSVLLINIVAASLRRMITWRTNRLLRVGKDKKAKA